MTVTLTIDELRAYQKSMESWVKAATLAEHVTKSPDLHGLSGIRSDRFEKFREEMRTWIEKNPMPKLVPKEL